MSTRLGASHDALLSRLRADPALREPEILDLLAARRALDLTDLTPDDQAGLLAARADPVLPSTGELRDRLAAGRALLVKFGIDPTTADVHLGHTVPMLLAARFQRMGHRVVVIVGDVTARIGDPSGRSDERPALSDEDVRSNLTSYRAQLAPFFDFERAGFRHNSEWLAGMVLPRFLTVLERMPVSAALQRTDFRDRLAAGHGLSLAELVYSVVMALDSVELAADVEIGGIDQLLNMRTGRRVMADAGQPPQLVLATPLIGGTDGRGMKMSKSRGNHIGLRLPAADLFGRIMSAPDEVLPTWLPALTELLDPEVELLLTRRPMAVKTLLAADVTAAVHGRAAADAAREAFAARFSRRRLSAAAVPAVARSGGVTVAAALVRWAGVTSRNEVRRAAAGGGLRLVVEHAGGAEVQALTPADADRPLSTLPAAPPGARLFLRCGRAVVEIS